MLKFLVYTIIFLLPVYLVKFPLPIGGTISLLDCLEVVLIIAFCSWAWNYQKKKPSALLDFSQVQSYFIAAAGLFLLGSFFAWLINATNTNWQDGLGIWKSYLLLPITSAAIMAFLCRHQVFKIERLAQTYLASAILIGVVALYYLLAGHLTYDHRLAGFYNSPNFLAMALAPGILIGVHAIIRWPTRQRIYLFLAMLPMAVSFVATFSLGGYIALTVSIVTIFFRRFAALAFRYAFFASLVSLALVASLPFWLKLSGYQPSVPATSFDSRIAIYRSAASIWQSHWLIGIGPNNFQKTYLDYQPLFPPYPQWAVPHPHNLMLSIAVDFGLLPLAALIFFLAKKQRLALSGKYPPLLLTLLVYLLIHGLVDNSIGKNDLALVFWLLLWL